MKLVVGTFLRPKEGEVHSGDFAFVFDKGEYQLIVIGDVLGHGEEAYQSSQKISSFLESTEAIDPMYIIKALDKALENMRGAAIGLCCVEKKTMKAVFSGVGNVSFLHVSDKVTRMLNDPGVVGERIRHIHRFEFQLKNKDLLVSYTDGIKTHFEIPILPRNSEKYTQNLAENIVKNYGKEWDDASCMVIEVKDE